MSPTNEFTGSFPPTVPHVGETVDGYVYFERQDATATAIVVDVANGQFTPCTIPAGHYSVELCFGVNLPTIDYYALGGFTAIDLYSRLPVAGTGKRDDSLFLDTNFYSNPAPSQTVVIDPII